LPHAWLESGGKRLSTHDLVAKDGFVLLTDPSGTAWVAAAEAAEEKFGVTIRAVTIGDGGDYADVDGVWAQVREISEGGAVLVRPDNHVAYRAASPVGDAREAVTRALGALLGR
jgi:2,4-dichlorophenol 6-monooxygenase